MLENYPQYIQYTSYFVLFLIAQSFSIWGQYVTLPFKSLTYWEAIKMALPYAWVNWFFMTFAINIGHSNDLVTPTQNIFLLIILQFSLILIMNYFYLKQTITRSDIIAFLILLIGYFISFYHIVSNMFGLPVPAHSSHGEKNVKKKNKKNKKEKKVRFFDEDSEIA
jgi:hypothetical protein